MSPTDCHALMSVCRPQLYQNNPFHLLGLPVDATARDIRRRQEDLKAAADSGAWDGEFGHLLAGREVPTPHEVNETFALLHDPERRVVEELFWFWPTEWGKGKQDEAIQGILRGKREASFELWSAGAKSTSSAARSVARHNLAVMYHLYAIRYEMVLLEGQELSDDASQRMASYWKQLIAHWNELGDDDAFWDVIADRVRGMDDPRLTTGFVRRMRQMLPQAFDKINATLAAEHARKGKGHHARRHLAYMKESHEGLDDVERTIAEILAPLEKMIGRIVEQAAKEAKADSRNALRAAQELMVAAQEPLETVKGLLDDGHAIRTQLLDMVASVCFGCLIDYGNKTEDWKPCIALLKQAEQTAATDAFKQKIRANAEIAAKNHEEKMLRETCWFCRRRKAASGNEYVVKMHGEVMSQWDAGRLVEGKKMYGPNGSIRLANPYGGHPFEEERAKGTCVWKHISIDIPCCRECAALPVSARGHNERQEPRANDFPSVKQLLQRGWSFGERPSESEQRKALGLPSAPVPSSPTQTSGCCVFLVAGLSMPLVIWLLKTGVERIL